MRDLGMETYYTKKSFIEFSKRCLDHTPDGYYVDLHEIYSLWLWWCKREGITTPTCKNEFVDDLTCLSQPFHELAGVVHGGSGRAIMNVKVTEWAQQEFKKGE